MVLWESNGSYRWPRKMYIYTTVQTISSLRFKLICGPPGSPWTLAENVEVALSLNTGILSKSPHFSGLKNSVRALGLTKTVPFSTKL